MTEASTQRRLAAILAADVVGYSRLMSQDEVRTLTALKELRREVFEPIITRHGGRLFKLIGDGALVEFSSAVNAVQCAIEIQESVATGNAGKAEGEHIVLRIGVHLGDVMVEGDDLYGDGVNIAARLEGLADPGGVLVSEDVHRQVGNKLRFTFNDVGPQNLKNIAQPVRAFRIGAATSSARSGSQSERSKDEISIAVLPFDNMSGDKEQDYFSDGITEDIITEISRFRELRVIARNSSFQFRGGKSDIREVGRKLDAKFIIEGSVRRSGKRIRISAQLIEGETGAHIWSDRYDREMVDVFQIQEEIAQTIATKVAGNTRASVVQRAKSRPTESLSAYELFLRARQGGLTYITDDGDSQFTNLLLRIIELDPQFAAVYGMLADHCSVLFLKTGDTKIIDKAVAFGRQGVVANPEDAWANYGLSIALIYKNSLAEAGFYLQRAVELNPNDVTFLAMQALWLSYVGRGEEALATINKALRRDPYTQEWFWDIQGCVFMYQRLYREALESFAKMRELYSWQQCFLAFCLAKIGDQEQAKSVLKAFRPSTLNLSPSGLMDVILPDIDPGLRNDFISTLRNVELA